MAAFRPSAVRALARQTGAFRQSPIAQMASKQPKFQPHLGSFQQENVMAWVPTLAMWGVGLGGAATLFLSPVPIFQNDVLKKLPIVSAYFEDKTPDTDKPF